MVLDSLIPNVLAKSVLACRRASRRRNVMKSLAGASHFIFSHRFLFCYVLKLVIIERRILLYEMLVERIPLYETSPAACFLVGFGYGLFKTYSSKRPIVQKLY